MFSMQSRLLSCLLWGLALVALPAGSKANLAQEMTSAQPSPKAKGAETVESISAGGDSYKIGVGDVLHISVWEEPQFTESAVVRPDGMISIPLISEVIVAGLTPQSAETMLTNRLEKFIHKPRVTVVVQEIHSRMVYITGEVQRPGTYPLVSSMNVVQLVARSGGLTDFAKSKQVYVLRAGSGARIKVDYQKLLKGQSPEKNLELVPGDTVVVP
jgi:polysaccharide export outer membrane protein